MQFQTNYELVPVSEKPVRSGLYPVIRAYSSNVEIAEYIQESECFTNYDGYAVTHWLRPIPESVVLTKEQVEEIFDAGERQEHSPGRYPDKQTFIDNYLK